MRACVRAWVRVCVCVCGGGGCLGGWVGGVGVGKCGGEVSGKGGCLFKMSLLSLFFSSGGKLNQN